MIRENLSVSFQEGQQLAGPPATAQRDRWLEDLKAWREKRWSELGGRPATSVYDFPSLKWTQRAFVQTKILVYDQFFFDIATYRYTVDRILDDLDERYGGVESIILWSVYPNIGVDGRNQLDYTRDLPGGVAALRLAIDRFHARGVKVLLQFMPWDASAGLIDNTLPSEIVPLAAEISADGLFADTLGPTPKAYWDAAEAAGFHFALEPENGLNHGDLRHPDGGLAFGQERALAWNAMSWGYWRSSYVPTVSKYKWLEPRHMVHLCQRWARDRNEMLQDAFFNGLGVQTWENIWGIWNGITPRDAATIRRIHGIYAKAPGNLTSLDWEPHYPTLNEGVFSSRFPGNDVTLYTFINRDEVYADGPQADVAHQAGNRYVDLWNGKVLVPCVQGDRALLDFRIEGDGFGAVLVSRDDVAANFSLRPVDSSAPGALFSGSIWRPLLQKQLNDDPVFEHPIRADRPPSGMVRIPSGDFLFAVSGMMIEGRNSRGVGVQYHWEAEPRRHHRHRLSIPEFWIDRTPVTNREYFRYLGESGYRPADPANYLKHWANGTYPPGTENAPVVWVSREDAEAFAHWHGKRLPHEWEWQYAAQGLDGRLYPWGNVDRAECRPAINQDPHQLSPCLADAHPEGASSFGLLDLVGNVWQWTDAYADKRTRFAILRGGSRYYPIGSDWYFPNTLRLDRHGKYLLMAPSLDRSGMIGFRCAWHSGPVVDSA